MDVGALYESGEERGFEFPGLGLPWLISASQGGRRRAGMDLAPVACERE